MIKSKRSLFVLLCCFVASYSFGQASLNFGIPQRQSKGELPKSKALEPQVERKSKIERKALLKPDMDDEYIITNAWEMLDVNSVVNQPILDADYNTAHWYNATVPGTVLTTLVDQGVYPDPYYGLNNLLIPESLNQSNWWYRIKFNAPDNVKGKGKGAQLLFNGINYKADVWLNGQWIGKMVGAFKRGFFDVQHLLKEKDNILAVCIYPPNNPGIGHEQNSVEFGPNGGALCLDGPTFIASEGWDWMPAIRDRNMGIWQDVRLCFNDNVVFEDPQVITDIPLPDTSIVNITVKVPLRNLGTVKQTFSIVGEIEHISFKKDVTLNPGENKEFIFTPGSYPQLTMKHPRLWWPNGYGNQSLYRLKLQLVGQNNTLNSKTVRFGVREFSYELAVDAPEKQGWRIEYSPTDVKQKGKILFNYKKLRDANVPNKNTFIPSLADGVELDNFIELKQNGNPYIVVKVNGYPIFCRGGDWGMDDAMKRVSREALEPAFKLHKLENFNMIRNWTGECTEEAFYDLCDEYGMLVWNDFWMSTGKYNLLPLDYDLFFANVTDVVKRFRNHASIALWCPRNEGYAEGLEDGLQQIILKEDGTRHYHGNSRELNMPGSGPWGYHDKPTEYFNRIAYGFNSELGSISIPPYNTLKKFMAKEDIWPIGDVWYYHDYHVKGWSGWDALLRDVNRLSKDTCNSIEEFCRRADVLNYNGHKIMFEAYNHKMWDFTSGVLYWMSHPAWPSLICQTYAYDLSTFGTFYGCKKSCEPTHIQWNINNQKVIVTNTTLRNYRNANISFSIYSLSGKKLYQRVGIVNVPMNDRIDLWEAKVPETISDLVIVRLTLKDNNGKVLSDNDYWYKNGYSNAPEGLCDIAITSLIVSYDVKQDGKLLVKVKNSGKVTAPFVRVNVVLADNGENLLPSYSNDNYFNLLPKESRTISIDSPKTQQKLQLKAEGVNCIQYFSIHEN